MLGKLVLLSTLMASFTITSVTSQYTSPVSVPVRFDLPGGYIDVRRTKSNANATAIGDEANELGRPAGSGHSQRGKKTRQRNALPDSDDDEYGDGSLTEKEFERQYKHVSRWSATGHKRRRNRFNKRGNGTYGRLPKKNLNDKRRNRNRGRKSNVPNRPGGGRPADGRYRSVDPQQKKVRRHILRLHNILRSHVMPTAADMLAVGWYETAAEQAQAWAEQCGAHTRADHPSIRWTSRYGACGQNVLVAPRKRRWSYVLRRWWSGKRYFRFGDDSNNSSVVSAYTQMAWYNSHQLGCGFAECATAGGSTFFRYVCNYCPSGNDPRRLSRPYTHGQSCRRCPNSCRSMCSRGQCKLCTNACTYSDLWVNCATLNKKWHEWLCNTKTSKGVERFKNCRATCQCMKRIT